MLNRFGGVLNRFGRVLNRFGRVLNRFGGVLNRFGGHRLRAREEDAVHDAAHPVVVVHRQV
ncbi:MAG: hypothetical protein JO242_28555, partial [Streptosporangiaceae bacterium]|nr:hypothetical protein [Streptosporangiaceae bacterium]